MFEKLLQKYPFLKSRGVLIAAVCGVAVALIGFGVYKYNQLTAEVAKLKAAPQTLQQASQNDEEQLVARVGRLIALPANEVPTVATVKDVTKLKNQPFFANAVDGDRVLMFLQSKKAILYRPSADKIIEVSPINVSPVDTGTPTPTLSPTAAKKK